MLALVCIQFNWTEGYPNEIHPLMHTSEIAFRVRRTRLMREYEAAICRRWKKVPCHAILLPSLPLSPRVRQALIYGSFTSLLPEEKEALLWPLFRTLDGGQTRVHGQHAYYLDEFFKCAV